jgi:hypothetical protein
MTDLFVEIDFEIDEDELARADRVELTVDPEGSVDDYADFVDDESDFHDVVDDYTNFVDGVLSDELDDDEYDENLADELGSQFADALAEEVDVDV